MRSFCLRRRKKGGDTREEEGAAARSRKPREEEGFSVRSAPEDGEDRVLPARYGWALSRAFVFLAANMEVMLRLHNGMWDNAAMQQVQRRSQSRDRRILPD